LPIHKLLSLALLACVCGVQAQTASGTLTVTLTVVPSVALVYEPAGSRQGPTVALANGGVFVVSGVRDRSETEAIQMALNSRGTEQRSVPSLATAAAKPAGPEPVRLAQAAAQAPPPRGERSAARPWFDAIGPLQRFLGKADMATPVAGAAAGRDLQTESERHPALHQPAWVGCKRGSRWKLTVREHSRSATIQATTWGSFGIS
jgi:hypothetical protein